MKHIYLIRHGRTVANERHIHQGPEEPLSQEGRKQAERLALFVKNLNVDRLISSTHTRARETAEILSKGIDVPLCLEDSLVEFRRPNRLYGKGHFSVGSLWYVYRMLVHRENPKWNDDGAENMYAVRNRVTDAKRMFMSLQGERIAAVSHAIFMDMFVTLACQEKELTVTEFIGGLLNFKKTPNTGIIHLAYDENVPAGICQWQLIEFIDPR